MDMTSEQAAAVEAMRAAFGQHGMAAVVVPAALVDQFVAGAADLSNVTVRLAWTPDVEPERTVASMTIDAQPWPAVMTDATPLPKRKRQRRAKRSG